MRIILEDSGKLLTNILDEMVDNWWITDLNKKELVNIKKQDGKIILHSNDEIKILLDVPRNKDEILTNINQTNEIELDNYSSYYLYEIKTDRVLKIHSLPVYDDSMIQLVIDFAKTTDIVIGNDSSATINCSNKLFSKDQILISYKDNKYTVYNNNLDIPMYINDIKINEKVIYSGDVIFIDGLVATIIGNILVINNPNNSIYYDSLKLAKRILPNNPEKDYTSEQETFIEVFSKDEYFQRPPRFKRSIEEKEFKVDPPPAGANQEEMPIIYTLGPIMLMGVTSIMSGMMAVMNVLEGKSSLRDNLMSIVTSITMLASMLVFPLLQRFWTMRQKKRLERKRRRKYKKYIDDKEKELLREVELQRQILIENNIDLRSVANVILNKERTLWDRKLEHDDFLNVRVGVGTVEPKVKLNLPEEHFTMEEDDLKDVYKELFNSIKDINDVPVTIDFKEHKITGIIGSDYNYVKSFIDGLMLNIFAYHSYDMLKLAVLTSNEKKNTWEKYRNLPHFWNGDKTFRMLGIGIDDVNKVSNYLIQEYNERKEFFGKDASKKDSYKNFKDYYLIISDETDYLKNTAIFNELMKEEGNIGFSFLIITENINSLPNECVKFLNIEPNNCAVFETELISTKQRFFEPDIPDFKMDLCYLQLCNIPINIEAGKYELPKSYSFLEMYNVGNVNQLNILNRWKNNNIINSLATPVGINEQGELFKLDLHEKAHGPHGLVAGMTGSGKSEWIITYILSMCINYHPDEVQFVLIDYKGGGLAGTFENKETGIRIPHLAGTITNLDVSEINRSLASINSELKRRQSLFNQARDRLGESSVDIYKYQRWYRDNKVETPISHLFIISDEFAELKAQQPEFMAELISTARIGRSLGVHLILATQKPSGVVDDQIWSNSKFRVCLKVQDKSDSNDMIKCPDAAMLKETGRFYLQVGYNEFFAKGQSAYAGAPYYESDRHKKTVDTELSFLSNNGEIYKEINSEKKITSAVFKGEELPSILKEIIKVADSTETHVERLWLDAIPENIYVDELLQKYEYKKHNYVLNPVIGEYDAPQYQKQALLTLPLSEGGNVLVYGISGSGKEKLITTILYSLMTNHISKEVNAYILDFGSEVFNCFSESPIVGDIIGAAESEKIKNYFKFIYKEFEKRKKLLKNYNGDYNYYIEKSNESMPRILTIINNYENMIELYGEAFIELLVKLTREAEKCGMLFIITINNTNGIGFRLSQNFKQSVCLQLKDPFDYKSLLGNHVRVVPDSKKGRGVIKINEEGFEFQTADPKNVDNLNEYIIELSKAMINNGAEKAKPISCLPKVIDYNYIADYYNTLRDLPIGLGTESLEVCQYNFLDNEYKIIFGHNAYNVNMFVKSLVELISMKKDSLKAVVFDPTNAFTDLKPNVTHVNDNHVIGLKNFISFLEKVSDSTKDTLIFFSALPTLLTLDNEAPKLVAEIFEKVKKIDKINIVLCGDVSQISSIGREDIFRKYFKTDSAIFIGPEFDSQYLITVQNKKLIKGEMQENYAYVIEKGKPTKIKILELFAEVEEEE